MKKKFGIHSADHIKTILIGRMALELHKKNYSNATQIIENLLWMYPPEKEDKDLYFERYFTHILEIIDSLPESLPQITKNNQGHLIGILDAIFTDEILTVAEDGSRAKGRC